MINGTTRTFNVDAAPRGEGLYVLLIGFLVLVGCDFQPEAATKSSEVPKHPVAQSDPANDGRLDEHTPEPEAIKPRSEQDPVAVRLSASQGSAHVGEAFEVSVVLNVDPAYEIHSLDASAPQIPTRLELELPPGFTAIGEWESPTPVRSFNPGGQSAYIGEVEFMRKIRIANDMGPGDYQLVCSVSYQACNSRRCLRPIKSVLEITMSVSP